MPIWTIAIAATVSAFVVHLALRGRTVELGYELGRARQDQGRLREVKRVLEVEAASYKTPERVEIVARTLLGMEPPPPDRIVSLAPRRRRARPTTRPRRESRRGSAVRNLDPARARWIRTRMGVLCGVMGLALGGIVASAWRVQVEDGPEWREMAEKQRQRRLHIEPKRGTIFDRNGTPLAVSVDVPSVSVDVAEMLRGVDGKPAQEATLRDAALRLAQALSMDPDEVYAKLEPRHRFVWIKRRITGDEAAAVRDLGDPKLQPHPIRGVAMEGEGHRYYPGRELAGSVLGFVAPDGLGKDGLELALDEDLRGKVEEGRGLRDRSGRLIFEGASDGHALQGYDVTLSIDEGIQHVAERELDAALHTYEPKGASLVVVDPMTGEILAISSAPGYNPNDYTESEADARRDRAVTDRFEPGSVMKPFMMATALAAGTLKPTDSIDCEHGVYVVAGMSVHDTEVNGLLTPTQILARSSNIGALKIGLQLGEPTLYAAYRRFGFGEETGVPLPGEAAGVLRPKGRPWVDFETATASYGQGISVTTLQLAMAMGAIANGGKLLEPILVKRVVNAAGDTVRESSTHVRREVVAPGVARTVAEMLTAVTEDGGTGGRGRHPRLPRGGKDVDRAEGRPCDGQVLDGEVHGRLRRLRAGRAPADRRCRGPRRADDWPLRRRPGRSGLPPRRRGQLALSGRDAVGKLGQDRRGEARRRPRRRDARRDEAAVAAAARAARGAAPLAARRRAAFACRTRRAWRRTTSSPR